MAQTLGLLKTTPVGWRKICGVIDKLAPEMGDKLDMTGLLSRLIADDTAIHGIPIDGNWGEVDSQSDLEVYQEMLQLGELQEVFLGS